MSGALPISIQAPDMSIGCPYLPSERPATSGNPANPKPASR